MNSVSVCPVPHEQLPINEYQELKDSWLFSWGTIDRIGYIRKLAWVWLWSWLLAGPIAAASFSPTKNPGEFALCAVAGASIGIVLVILRLYLGWSYVRDRLISPTVVYEESGWYDGQTWDKPQEVLLRDRLIVTYEIQPILLRLKQTFALLTLLFGLDAIIWIFL